ncbi:unnamed protein product [Lepeophtheirus salmonis]|nr:unnamed protein product [Lepeophtheirus salmonis]CAF2777821.1 unnamed protein product [Lepeophtheirus salmonis]
MDPDLSDASLQEEEDMEEEEEFSLIDGSDSSLTNASEEIRGFHGWRAEEVPVRDKDKTEEECSFEPEELSRPFKPYIFRRIPAYKYLDASEEIAGFSTTTLIKSASTGSGNGSKGSGGSGSGANQHNSSSSSGSSKKKKSNVNVSITPSLSSKREWRPSSQYFKPLQMGWVREVVLSVSEGETLVFYHSPQTSNKKNKTFKLLGELETYLNHSNSGLSTLNFSFRRESMGAPYGQEIVRYENEDVEIFPNKSVEMKK